MRWRRREGEMSSFRVKNAGTGLPVQWEAEIESLNSKLCVVENQWRGKNGRIVFLYHEQLHCRWETDAKRHSMPIQDWWKNI